MHLRRDKKRCTQRAARALGNHWSIFNLQQVEDPIDVARALLDLDVPCHGGDCFHREFAGPKRQDQRKGVIDAGVGINQDWFCHDFSPVESQPCGSSPLLLVKESHSIMLQNKSFLTDRNVCPTEVS
jgi:hypothetical protein